MPEYQVLARKYRPQQFCDVVGQDAIVTTLKNAMKRNRVAHAYLFCGPRGTGKTTLARLFAKALNCTHLTDNGEPCNQCTSCKEITSGSSLDVLEIDGASNRGIEEIRQIKETVGYSSSTGSYRIYIIDEVHMLTKEAFNALLKTLEEPPAKVKFFFATTEPHKVLPTIMSRCQRFDLKRIDDDKIRGTLRKIASDLGVKADDEALQMITARAGGGLRDAESLFDQILAFHDGTVTTDVVSTVLGMMPQEVFFSLDRAGQEGNLSVAFTLVHQVFSQGKDIAHFLEALIEHYRTILLTKLSEGDPSITHLSPAEQSRYAASAKIFSQEQCLTILDIALEAQGQIKLMSSPRIALEALLLKIIRSHRRVPVEYLVRRLTELEQAVSGTAPAPKAPAAVIAPPPPAPAAPVVKVQAPQAPIVCEDPTPTLADLGIRKKSTMPKETPQVVSPPISTADLIKAKTRHDTILQFAAVELEGKVERK